jgi:hypothetical protein
MLVSLLGVVSSATSVSGITMANTGPAVNMASISAQQQGLAWDGSYYYYTTTTGLYKLDSNMNIVASNVNAAAQCGGDHMGDGAVYNGKLYAVCVNSANGWPWTGDWIGIWNTRDLSFASKINVKLTSPSSSAASVNPNANLILNMELTEGGKISAYDLTTSAYKGSITPSSPLWYNEGMDYYNGHYYVTSLATHDSQGANDATGGVFIMNTDGSGVQRIIPYSAFTHGGELEGIDVKSDYIRAQCGGYVYLFTTGSPYTLVKTMAGV